MNFLLDENINPQIADFLTNLGHNVLLISEDFQRSLVDETVLSIALRENRTLITHDRDFGSLIFEQGQGHAGVLYIRLRSFNLERTEQRLREVLEEYRDELNNFIVVSENRVRIRRPD